jgi:hypothetical protein
MDKVVVNSYEDFEKLLGRQIGISDYVEVSQDRINLFADATLISANCYPQNKRSQRVLEKMGFTYEGILHQAEVSYDDKIYDHLCYYLEKNNLK